MPSYLTSFWLSGRNEGCHEMNVCGSIQKKPFLIFLKLIYHKSIKQQIEDIKI